MTVLGGSFLIPFLVNLVSFHINLLHRRKKSSFYAFEGWSPLHTSKPHLRKIMLLFVALVMEKRDPCDDNKLVQSIQLQGQAKCILVATLIHFLPFCNEFSNQIEKYYSVALVILVIENQRPTEKIWNNCRKKNHEVARIRISSFCCAKCFVNFSNNTLFSL